LGLGVREGMESVTPLALACAAGLRLGGALYVITEQAGLAEPYYLADAGLRAGLRAAAGRTLNQDVLRHARSGLTAAESGYSAEHAAAFVRVSFGMLRRILQAMERSNSLDDLTDIPALAVEAAALWPEPVRSEDVSSGNLVTYEQGCQIGAQEAWESGGPTGLRQVLGTQELVYRRLARALVSR
jgi:hypothetical protein